MKVGILGKISKVKDPLIIDGLLKFVEDCGYQTKRFVSPNEIDAEVDVVIVLGGDGAILHASVIAAKKGVKVIGVNFGNLGFLAEFEKTEWNELQPILKQLETNSCRILKRSLLECRINDKTFYALNEIALQRDSGSPAIKFPQMLRLDVQTKEGKTSISGDGLLVSTPTGSTAYSLSAGGAIVTPEVPVFMLTPICAFSMRSRPIVVSDAEEFILKVEKGNAIVSADGYPMEALSKGDEIYIKKAPFTADFPVRENSDFFAKIRNKLSE